MLLVDTWAVVVVEVQLGLGMVDSDVVDRDMVDIDLMCFGALDWDKLRSDMADWAVVRCAGADLPYAGIAIVGSASVDHASVPRVIVHLATRGMVVAGMRPAAHSIG